jgi:hypothetical protein
MTHEINIDRLRLRVPDVVSAAEGRALAKAVALGMVDSLRETNVGGSLDGVKVRVPGGRATAGDVVGAVRSAIARETSSLRNEKRRS